MCVLIGKKRKSSSCHCSVRLQIDAADFQTAAAAESPLDMTEKPVYLFTQAKTGLRGNLAAERMKRDVLQDNVQNCKPITHFYLQIYSTSFALMMT